jgi:hypothetical protein
MHRSALYNNVRPGTADQRRNSLAVQGVNALKADWYIAATGDQTSAHYAGSGIAARHHHVRDAGLPGQPQGNPRAQVTQTYDKNSVSVRHVRPVVAK